MSKHTALLIGDARMAFPVARALSRAGHNVHAGVSIYSNYLEWSRYIDKSFAHASLEPGTDEALADIEAWLVSHPEIDTVQPVSEAGARFVARHQDLFEAHATVVSPGKAIVDKAYDKTGMFELCASLDGPLAPYRAIASMDELRAAIDEIGYPFILKPSKVDAYIFGGKALILHNQEDLSREFPHWPEIHPELILQRYLTGRRHSVIFSAKEGRLLGAVEICAARTHINDGTGNTTYGITIEPTPEIRDSVERFVSALNYTSTGCLQYLVSPKDREITFMELNPRVSLARLAECAGLPHSLWGLALAHGEEVDGFDDPWSLPSGVEYVWTKGELTLLGSLFRRGEIGFGEFTSRFGRAVFDIPRCHHAVFDIVDPLPAIGVYGNKLIAPIRKTLTGRQMG
ncbi:MAG: hypothetical protein AAFX02_05095 [Pseudomonadota bacterium]